MKRLVVVLVAVGGTLAATPAAQAAPLAPAPTVTVSTSAGGQMLPVASMSGAWQVNKPGRKATLKVNGVVVTGTQTTIRSTWVSSMRRSVGIKFGCEGDFNTVAPGAAKNAVQIHVEYRVPGGHWQNMGNTKFDYTSQPLASAGEGIGAFLAFVKPVKLQWRLRVTATYADTSQQSFYEQVEAV